MIFSSKVPCNCKKVNLLDYLCNRFTYFSSEQWRQRIAEEKVLLNGSISSVSDEVNGGDSIQYDAGDFDEPPADLAFAVVYEDDYLLGINKPGNLLVHRAGRSFRNNLIYQLRYAHSPLYPNCHSVHRLDRETSGVVLVVKSPDWIAPFGTLFNEGRIEKHYKTIVKGKFSEQLPMHIDNPISQDKASGISYRQWVNESGKQALTRIDHALPLGDHYTLLSVTPLSGRTHQIRVHLASMGYPIAGDRLYNLDPVQYLSMQKEFWSHSLSEDISRHALHCESLSFVHPFTQRPLTISADLPDDMVRCITKLVNSK